MIPALYNPCEETDPRTKLNIIWFLQLLMTEYFVGLLGLQVQAFRMHLNSKVMVPPYTIYAHTTPKSTHNPPSPARRKLKTQKP